MHNDKDSRWLSRKHNTYPFRRKRMDEFYRYKQLSIFYHILRMRITLKDLLQVTRRCYVSILEPTLFFFTMINVGLFVTITSQNSNNAARRVLLTIFIWWTHWPSLVGQMALPRSMGVRSISRSPLTDVGYFIHSSRALRNHTGRPSGKQLIFKRCPFQAQSHPFLLNIRPLSYLGYAQPKNGCQACMSG